MVAVVDSTVVVATPVMTGGAFTPPTGESVAQPAAPISMPVLALTDASAVVVPEPSSKCHNPRVWLSDANGMADGTKVVVYRTTSDTRTSSISPAKWMLDPSSMPIRSGAGDESIGPVCASV